MLMSCSSRIGPGSLPGVQGVPAQSTLPTGHAGLAGQAADDLYERGATALSCRCGQGGRPTDAAAPSPGGDAARRAERPTRVIGTTRPDPGSRWSTPGRLI